MEAYRNEWDTWVATNSYTVVKWDDMVPGSIITRLYELAQIKKDGRHKIRPCLAGETLEPHLDFGATWAGTISTDMTRFLFSLATSLNVEIWAGDVSCAFLQAKNDRPLYSYKPSWFDLINLDWDQLSKLRAEFKPMEKKMLRKMAIQKGRVEEVLSLLSAIYGNPAATRLWVKKNHVFMTHNCKLKNSNIDGQVYYLNDVKTTEGSRTKASMNNFLVVGLHVDDMLIVGNDHMKEEFCKQYEKACDGQVKWQKPVEVFTSMEVKQDLVNGHTELTQSKYWDLAAIRFKEFLPDKFNVHNPIGQGYKFQEATDEEHDEAKHLPYMELVGTLNYPTTMTKLECRLHVSKLSKYLRKWSKEHWDKAIKVLMYCITTKKIGIIYSRSLDEHGVNILYDHADSGFSPERSDGCRYMMMNGAVTSGTAKQHPTVDDSSTLAEITECKYAADDVVTFRGFLGELGFELEEPSIIYQDNRPAIMIANGEKSLGSKSRHMLIRCAKLSEHIADQDAMLKWKSTVQLIADLGTKFHGKERFEFLRDLMNGYALVRASQQEYDVPKNVTSLAMLTLKKIDGN